MIRAVLPARHIIGAVGRRAPEILITVAAGNNQRRGSSVGAAAATAAIRAGR